MHVTKNSTEFGEYSKVGPTWPGVRRSVVQGLEKPDLVFLAVVVSCCLVVVMLSAFFGQMIVFVAFVVVPLLVNLTTKHKAILTPSPHLTKFSI